MSAGDLLQRWLAARLSPGAAAWLQAGVERLRGGAAERDLYLLSSMVTRHVGHEPLALGEAELAAASRSRPGWDPSDWTQDQAARVYLLLASTPDGAETSRRLERLCSAADVGELVGFYRGLPLYPDPPRYALRAAEGIRSNMRVVFEAVAHRNPYPAEQLPEAAWNQLVLKALFIGSGLDRVVGLDSRRNPTLARMLCDYAHERWSASRPVRPELWRCVGPFASGPLLHPVRHALEHADGLEREAAALALCEARDAEAMRLLDTHPALARSARDGNLTWARVAAARA
jgi:hypothetical protein